MPGLAQSDIALAMDGKARLDALVNVCSYNLVKNLDAGVLRQRNFHVIVADECHLLKNQQSARTRTVTPLLKVRTVFRTLSVILPVVVRRKRAALCCCRARRRSHGQSNCLRNSRCDAVALFVRCQLLLCSVVGVGWAAVFQL